MTIQDLHHQLCVVGLRCPGCGGEGGFTERTGPTDVDQYRCETCHGTGRVRYEGPFETGWYKDVLPVITWDGKGGALPWLAEVLGLAVQYRSWIEGDERWFAGEMVERAIGVDAPDPLTLMARIIEWWEGQQ